MARKITIEELMENSAKDVRVTRNGLVIGDEPFPYPVAEGSIKLERLHKRNILTFSIYVTGEVTFEERPTRNAPASTITVWQCGRCNRPIGTGHFEPQSCPDGCDLTSWGTNSISVPQSTVPDEMRP